MYTSVTGGAPAPGAPAVGTPLYNCKLQLSKAVKGGGTGPAGPAKAGPLFHTGSNIFEQTKKTNRWMVNK